MVFHKPMASKNYQVISHSLWRTNAYLPCQKWFICVNTIFCLIIVKKKNIKNTVLDYFLPFCSKTGCLYMKDIDETLIEKTSLSFNYKSVLILIEMVWPCTSMTPASLWLSLSVCDEVHSVDENWNAVISSHSEIKIWRQNRVWRNIFSLT